MPSEWNTNCPPPWEPNDEMDGEPMMRLLVTSLCVCEECGGHPDAKRHVYETTFAEGDGWAAEDIAWRLPVEPYQGPIKGVTDAE